MNYIDYINTDPKIMFGKPVIKGTRIPVDLILEKLSYGETIPQLIKSYPRVTKNAIHACLMYASQSLKNEIVITILMINGFVNKLIVNS